MEERGQEGEKRSERANKRESVLSAAWLKPLSHRNNIDIAEGGISTAEA